MFFTAGENGSEHFYREICSLYGSLKVSNQISNIIIFVPSDSLVRMSQMIQGFGHDSVIIEHKADTLATQDSSALDTLIAENRQRLAKRIAERNTSEDSDTGASSVTIKDGEVFFDFSSVALF